MGGSNTSGKSVTGKIIYALDFNGTADYVDCNQTFQATARDSFSISCWVKPDDGQQYSWNETIQNWELVE